MFYRYVSSVSYDVAKVDLDIAVVVHVCCKILFPIFHLFFQTYVVSVFISILCMFHTYVASVLYRYCVCFTTVSSVFLGVFASVFGYMFRVFLVFRRMLQVLCNRTAQLYKIK
jgi:hypothetical protein